MRGKMHLPRAYIIGSGLTEGDVPAPAILSSRAAAAVPASASPLSFLLLLLIVTSQSPTRIPAVDVPKLRACAWVWTVESR